MQGVPVNEMHSKGFVSIGCEPCTIPILPNQHEREGRWAWEVSFCVAAGALKSSQQGLGLAGAVGPRSRLQFCMQQEAGLSSWACAGATLRILMPALHFVSCHGSVCCRNHGFTVASALCAILRCPACDEAAAGAGNGDGCRCTALASHTLRPTKPGS